MAHNHVLGFNLFDVALHSVYFLSCFHLPQESQHFDFAFSFSVYLYDT